MSFDKAKEAEMRAKMLEREAARKARRARMAAERKARTADSAVRAELLGPAASVLDDPSAGASLGSSTSSPSRQNPSDFENMSQVAKMQYADRTQAETDDSLDRTIATLARTTNKAADTQVKIAEQRGMYICLFCIHFSFIIYVVLFVSIMDTSSS
jgi:hypothetical protein